MITKIRVILVIAILFVSALIIGLNPGFAEESEMDNGDQAVSARAARSGGGNYHWSSVFVVSEPVLGQNNNDALSVECKVAVEDDNVYVVWGDESNLHNAGAIESDIFYRWFNGSEWSDTQVISEPVYNEDNNVGWSSNPSIAVENGKIYVVWEDMNDTYGAGNVDADIFYRTNLTGNGWEDIQVISEPVKGATSNIEHSSEPEIAVDNGKIYVVWHDNNDTNNAGNTDADIFFKTNITGNGWEPVVVISEPVLGGSLNTDLSSDPAIAVENGDIYVTWFDSTDLNGAGSDADIFYRYKPSGGAWQGIVVISEPITGLDTNDGISFYPDIKAENGNIYCVWEDSNNTNSAGTSEYDIFYTVNLSGSGWEPVQVISEPVAGQDNTNGDSHNPTLAVENGEIYVVWESANNTDNSGAGDYDIFHRSNLTGSGWEQIEVISEPIAKADTNTVESFDPIIAVNIGKSHVVWFDTNNTNGASTDMDIFYMTTYAGPKLMEGNVTPSMGNTSTIFNFTVMYYDGDNDPPTEVNVTINEMNYTMTEVNQSDLDYVDGKLYYYTTVLPSIADNYTYQYWTSDGNYTTFTLPVDNPDVYNTVPLIVTANNKTAYEDALYEVDYEYEDMDEANAGQVLTWNFSTDAVWLKFDLTTGVLNGTPLDYDVGSYWVNISINDSMAVNSTNFTLEVINTNDPPKIITANNGTAYEDDFYEVDYGAEDIDNAPLELSWSMTTNTSAWLTMNPLTGVLKGTPSNDDVGDYWVNITVSDSLAEDFTNFTLKVINMNDPPKIIGTDDTNAVVDEKYSVKYEAEDIDPGPDTLSWGMATNITGAWLIFDYSTGWLNGTPTASDVGVFYVNISISDGNGGKDYRYFILKVTKTPVDVNAPPEITTTDKLTAMVGKLYSIGYEATDDRTPVGDLTWSYASNATWLVFATSTSGLSGTPGDDDVGTYWVNITVSDGEGALDFHNFTIKVTKESDGKPGVNTKPILTEGKMEPKTGDEDTEFTFSVHYYDADGDLPEYIRVVIDGHKYDMDPPSGEPTADGTYEYKTKLSKGEHTYYFEAHDGTDPAITGDTSTPISESDPGSTEAISEPETKSSNMLIAAIAIIVIIIILVFLIVIMKSRKKEEEAPVPYEGAAMEEEPAGPLAEAAEGEGEAEGVAEPVALEGVAEGAPAAGAPVAAPAAEAVPAAAPAEKPELEGETPPALPEGEPPEEAEGEVEVSEEEPKPDEEAPEEPKEEADEEAEPEEAEGEGTEEEPKEEESEEAKEEETAEQDCPVCGAAVPAGKTACPDCGKEV